MRAAPEACVAALVAALLASACCHAEISGRGSGEPAPGNSADPGLSPSPSADPSPTPETSPDPGPSTTEDSPERAPSAPPSPEPAPAPASVVPIVWGGRRAGARAARAPAPAASSPKSSRSISGWSASPNTQYHIQTDEGPERYFKYQTISGQYRKEKRLQDGTVVGSYGWVDPNGYLRLRDYVADGAGYRVLKTKMVYVGKDEPIGNAVSKAKHVPSQGGAGFVPPGSAAPATTPAPARFSARPSWAGYTASTTPYYTSSPLLYSNIAAAPLPSNSLGYGDRRYDAYDFQRTQPRPQAPFPLYDGVSATHNGFRYYLPRHYHEEETLPGERRSGSFGYVDPFGIRRVLYYNAAPGSGFVHRKNNRYVGFNATPYDPRF